MTVTFVAPASKPPLTGIAAALSTLVQTAIPIVFAQNPRSLQKAIGPSEVGVPCDLRLAYRSLDWPSSAAETDPLPAIVGTAGHAWLAEAFTAIDALLGPGRFLVEHRVDVTPTMSGKVDLFDRALKTGIDWKFLGPTSLNALRKDGPSDQYRVQAHLYAKGLVDAGEPVDNVALVCFPRGGYLFGDRGVYVWAEPYDADVAQAAIDRLERIVITATELDVDEHPERFGLISRTPGDACTWCPFHVPKSTDFAVGCPGTTA